MRLRRRVTERRRCFGRQLFGIAAASRRWRSCHGTLQPPDTVESWLMFDGVCNLCRPASSTSAGRLLLKVKFGAQQKHMELLERVGAPTDLSTLVLIQGPNYYVYSGSALRARADGLAVEGALGRRDACRGRCATLCTSSSPRAGTPSSASPPSAARRAAISRRALSTLWRKPDADPIAAAIAL